MADQTITSETDGADRVTPAEQAGRARSNPFHGLFGAKLLGDTGVQHGQRPTPRLPRSLY